MILDELEEMLVFADVASDPEFDWDLFALDVELTGYAPPGYSRLDEDELFARALICGYIGGERLA